MGRHSQEEYKKEIIQGFKTAIDFYRMEYSDDLLSLFNEFGYLLLCRLFCAGYFEESREKQAFRIERYDRNYGGFAGDVQVLLAKQAFVFRDEAETDRRFSEFINTDLKITRNSVLHPISQVMDEVLDLWKEFPDKRVIFETVYQIHELCAGSRADRDRYSLPGQTARELVFLLKEDRKAQELEPARTVFDPQYGSGEMLIAASRCLKEAALYGYESNAGLRMSAKLLCVLSGASIKDAGENFLMDASEVKYDMILANPPFSNDSVPDNPWAAQEYDMLAKSGLRRIKMRYNLFMAKTLLRMEENGSAAIVVPDSFLFSSRRETVDVRKWILNSYQVEAVVSLPAKTFYPSTSVRSSVLIVSKPFLRSWPGYTEYVLFYQMEAGNDTPAHEEEYQELQNVLGKRPDYYKEWWNTSGVMLENTNNVKTPEHWQYPRFWFTDYWTLQDSDWNLLPGYYQPPEMLELKFESPQRLLEEMMKLQDEIAGDMRRLSEEVRDLW